MAPINDEEAYGRVAHQIINSKVAMGAILYALGGGTFTLMDRIMPEKPNPQMAALMDVVNQVPEMQDTLTAHGKIIQETRIEVAYIDERLAMMEPDNSRTRRPRGLGRHRE